MRIPPAPASKRKRQLDGSEGGGQGPKVESPPETAKGMRQGIKSKARSKVAPRSSFRAGKEAGEQSTGRKYKKRSVSQARKHTAWLKEKKAKPKVTSSTGPPVATRCRLPPITAADLMAFAADAPPVDDAASGPLVMRVASRDAHFRGGRGAVMFPGENTLPTLLAGDAPLAGVASRARRS